MKQLPNYWKYRTNLPQPPALEKEGIPAYLLRRFEEAYNEGYEQCQEDLRELIGRPKKAHE